MEQIDLSGLKHGMIVKLVQKILQTSHAYNWTLQGFGMLRLYMPDLRLHIWDDRFRVLNVSDIHNHPWDFYSYIVAGNLENQLILYGEDGAGHPGAPYRVQTIACGEGGGPMPGTEKKVRLVFRNRVLYRPGEVYAQTASMVHESHPERGTVTLVSRPKGQAEHALVFWPEGESWVSAEPRPATPDEVEAITSEALRLHF